MSDKPTNDQPEQASNGEMRELTQEEVMQWTIENMGRDVIAMLSMYSNLDDEQKLQHAQAAVNEQLQVMDQIIPTLINAEQVKSHPTLMIKVRGPKGVTGVFEASKTLHGVEDPGRGIATALTLALLHSPGIRALLRVYGFDYTFMQSAKNLDVKKIILA